MASRTYTISITTINNNGSQEQCSYGPYSGSLSVMEAEGECLVNAKAKVNRESQWFIVVIAGSDYGFIVQKFNGDGSFANEMVDKE